jgi:hypothetical protein
MITARKRNACIFLFNAWLALVAAMPLDASAQPTSTPSDQEAAAACAGCGVMLVAIAVGILVLHIAILVWVARDAKARGLENAVGWLFLIVFTGIIGLAVYVLSRPKGALTRCPHCGNNRMQVSAKCPYCGNV